MPEVKSETAIDTYETDFYAWTQEQADLLRTKHWSQIDLPNLIEEIESLGQQQRQELRNRLSVLIGHLLKWEYQPQHRSQSGLATLRVQRRDILRLLKDNPSLNAYVDEAFQETYENAKDLAMGETDLPAQTFPTNCPYRLSEVLGDRSYPGAPSELVDAAEP